MATIVHLFALGVFLVICGLGLRADNATSRLLGPMGLLGVTASLLYFALGGPYERTMLWITVAIWLVAAIWLISLLRQGAMPAASPASSSVKSRLAMITFAADTIAALILLYVLRKPVPILIGYVLIGLWSLWLMRRLMPDSLHPGR